MIVLGITGRAGSGKGETVAYLKEKGFRHFSVRAFLLDEMKRRKMPYTRESAIELGNTLRKEHSPSYIIESLYAQGKRAEISCVIESLRTVAEISFLRNTPRFKLIAIDADQHTRYERILKRQGQFDHVSFEDFVRLDIQESASKDPDKQNLTECIRQSDFLINNDGTLDELHKEIDKIIKQTASQ